MSIHKNRIFVADTFLVNLWDFEKNELEPNEVSLGSHKKAWWVCEKFNHSHLLSVAAKNRRPEGCSVCAGRQIIVGINNVGFTHPHVLKLWDFSDKNVVTPDTVSAGGHYRIWWKCNSGHGWQALLPEVALGGKGCPYCSGQKVLTGFNDLLSQVPDAGSFWNFEKNLGDPSNVNKGSHLIAWWKCQHEHEWQTKVHKFTGGTRCPYCSGTKVIPGKTSLADKRPELVPEWHPSKNGSRTPYNVSSYASYRAWWVCGKNKSHEWEAVVGNRFAGNGCPSCSKSNVSVVEQELATFISNMVGEQNIVVNSKKVLDGRFELDVYIPKRNLAVEFNGLYWHSEKKGKLSQYHYDKWKACQGKGVELIQVWEDDWYRNPELVKRLLLEKINVQQESPVSTESMLVKPLTQSEVNEFLAQNHIQGAVEGSVRLGLTVSDTQIGVENSTPGERLVAVMVLDNAPDTDGKTLNLLRFATSEPVTGGFRKLLEHAEQSNGIEKIVGVSDNCFSSSSLFEANGFINIGNVDPDYMLIVKNRRVNKETVAVVEDLNGYNKIWDAGQTRWVKCI